MLESDEIQRQLMSIFQAELDEHLATLNKGLLALEQEPTPDARAAIRQSERILCPQHVDTLLLAADAIKDVMATRLRGEVTAREKLDALFAQLAVVMRDMGSAAGESAKPPAVMPIPENASEPAAQPEPAANTPEGLPNTSQAPPDAPA